MSATRADLHALAELRAANPVSIAEVRGAIDEDELSRRLAVAIAAGEEAGDSAPLPGAGRGRLAWPVAARRGAWRGRRRMAPLLVGACAAALAALVVLLAGTPGGGGRPEFAAAAIRVAQANPRLLVTAPGWSVTDAGEFEADEGEVTFGDGRHRLSITWYPARMYRSYLRDRAQVSPPQRSRLLGRAATTVHYGHGTSEYATMLAPQGIVFVEARGDLGGYAEYESVLHSLRRVDVKTWLAAMPPSVVRPNARVGAIERMLRGVPLPPSFDATHLESGSWVANRYQLAVRVAGAVSCGWVESWLAARRAGDRPRARHAVEAMATSSRWPMMPLLKKGGGWSANVRHAALELKRGHLDGGAEGALVRPDGSGYELGPSWARGLNCTSRFWRRPLRR